MEHEYKLVDCMGIDQTELRRIFFVGLEDMQRRSSNLQEGMLRRNKLIKESMLVYARSVDKLRKRQASKKIKIYRMEDRRLLAVVNHK